MRLGVGISVLLLALMANSSAMGASWVFTLADTVRVSSPAVQLSEISTTPVPSRVSDLNICSSGMPGTIQTISRKTILRQLVTSGMAGGVSCVIIRTGKTINPHALRPDIRRVLQALVPGAKPGAPATWFELELPEKLAIVDDKNYEIIIARNSKLTPGRNQITVVLNSPEDTRNFQITVTLHQFDETAKALMQIKRGDILLPELFQWEWADLSDPKQNSDFHGRNELNGVSCSRTIQAGDYLRRCDLKATPVIFAGDRVELQIQRGALFASVDATARREGSIGQTIPVRNELTKQLMNVRVVGPGVVKWRN